MNPPRTPFAPLPYYGGKRHWTADVWRAIGERPDSYLEPFAGSLACLVASPYGPAPREIVSDANGHVCNFFRSVRTDPEAVLPYLEWPSSHLDLSARHQFL